MAEAPQANSAATMAICPRSIAKVLSKTLLSNITLKLPSHAGLSGRAIGEVRYLP